MPLLRVALGCVLLAGCGSGVGGGAVEGKGTAGSARGGVITVQGESGATPVPVQLDPAATIKVQAPVDAPVPVTGSLAVSSVAGVVSVQAATGTVQPVGGLVAHGAGVGSSNPLLLGARVASAGAPQAPVPGGNATQLNADGEGRLLVRGDHPNAFYCRGSATVGTNSQLCAAGGPGLATYVTDVQIQITTAGAAASTLTLGHNTAGTCSTPSTPFYDCAASALGTCTLSLHTPIRIGPNEDLCATGSGSGLARVYLSGYRAP